MPSRKRRMAKRFDVFKAVKTAAFTASIGIGAHTANMLAKGIPKTPQAIVRPVQEPPPNRQGIQQPHVYHTHAPKSNQHIMPSPQMQAQVSRHTMQTIPAKDTANKIKITKKPLKIPQKIPLIKKTLQTTTAGKMTYKQKTETTNFLKQEYLNKGRQLKPGDPDFKKLVQIESIDGSINWYGAAVKNTHRRMSSPQLAHVTEHLAVEYKKKFGSPINYEDSWSDSGHVPKSSHRSGLGLDLDVGPDVGTAEYYKWGKKRFEWIANFLEINHPEVRILFAENLGPNVIVPRDKRTRNNHRNHMHID